MDRPDKATGILTLKIKPVIIWLMRLSTLLAIVIGLTCCYKAEAKKCNRAPIRIAVIDTGFGYHDLGHDAHLCQYGHKDFSSDRQFSSTFPTKVKVPLDVHGHGTNIAGIIDEIASAAHVNYCLVIIKYYSEQQTGHQNLVSVIRAINYAANIKADYINYSGGGPEFSMFEHSAVERYLNQGGHLIAAAGNEHSDIDLIQNYYFPASYDPRIVVVGNLKKNLDASQIALANENKDGIRSDSSNYGKHVTRWEVGEDVTAYGITMTGTSQATAVATGKIVSESDNKCDIGF